MKILNICEMKKIYYLKGIYNISTKDKLEIFKMTKAVQLIIMT